jgi:hypothetical protein
VYLKVHLQSVKSGWAFEKMKLQAQAFCFFPPIIPARYHRKKEEKEKLHQYLSLVMPSNQIRGVPEVSTPWLCLGQALISGPPCSSLQKM